MIKWIFFFVFLERPLAPLTLLSFFFSYMLRGDTQKLYYPSLARIMYIWYKLETVYYSESETISQNLCIAILISQFSSGFDLEI